MSNTSEQDSAKPLKEVAVIFRAAKPEEFDVLSRILCNAFLPLWNHNWFHGVSEALAPVAIGSIGAQTPPMSRYQATRVYFYRSLINLVSLWGGLVLVAEVPGPGTANGINIGAIMMWLPPHVREGTFGMFQVWRSGLLSLLAPWRYGLSGFYRITAIFEANVKSMFEKRLKGVHPGGYKEEECGFVQMIAINPAHAGKGYASALLKHQVEKHFAQYPDKPVILDTTTKQGLNAYGRLGFELLAQIPVDTGTDVRGIRLKTNADESARKLAKETCVQRVMIKVPPGAP
ncbi:uncharacterized protein A1O9_10683, partial [Exophiala aquamarina CBS 119918]